MDNQKRIEKIWKENPKIPFMQSKDILAYGYNMALSDVNKNFINKADKIVNKKEEEFVGTAQELQNQINKKVNNKKQENKENKEKSLLKQEEIKEIKRKAKAELLGELYGEIYKSKNLQDFYLYLEKLKEKYIKY